VKITALEVDGFGVWSGLKLERLSDGLNVFYGPNEAGKTTLLEFVRSMLYGFSPSRRRYLAPVTGGRPGGSLHAASAAGRFQIVRHDIPRDGDADSVAVVGPDGARHGAELLKTLLSNVDETIFNNVFAVGLRDLQELGTLSDTEASAMLYNLSMGLDRVSLVEVSRELEVSRNRLLDPHGKPCQVGQLVQQRDKLRAEIEELGTVTRRFARLSAERDQTDRDTARLEQEVRQLQHQTRVVEIALAQYDRWQRRAVLAEQLSAQTITDAVPEGTLHRLEGVVEKLKRHQQAVRHVRRQQAEIRREAAGLRLNEALWRLAPRVEAVKEQEGWIATLERQTAELEAEIGQLEAQMTAEHQRFGLGEGAGPRGISSLSSRSLMALRYPAKALSRLRRQLEQAQQEVSKARETAETLSSQIDSALRARGEKDVAQAMERVGGLVSQLRRRVQLDERIDQMGRYQGELEEESHRLLERQLLPVPIVVGLGAMFVVGVILFMAGMFLPESLVGGFGWPLVLLGMAASGGAVATKFFIERTNALRLEDCQKQINMLQLQIKQARQEREVLDEQLPRGGGPIVARLQSAEKELAALEGLVPLDARRQAAAQEAEGAAERARQADSGLASAQRRWRDSLAKAGLPQNLSPKQARDLVLRCEDVVDVQRRLDRRYEEFQQRSHELEALKARIVQLASDCRVTLSADQPIAQVRQLVEELNQQESRRRRRDELHARARRLRRKRAQHAARVAVLKRRRRELLQTAGVTDEGTLRERIGEITRVQELRREHLAIQREIEAAIAGCCGEDDVAGQLQGATKEALEARRLHLDSRCQAAEAQLQKRFEARGRLNEQLRTVADDRGPGLKQIELAVAEKRVEDAVGRWRVLAVASRILQGIRKTYERDRQPETLRESSQYLQLLTEGRYARVWTPLDDDILLVDDARGKPLSIDALSQGTREQLFLALRLAMAGCYARRGAELPMILDDVLVNFDTRRAGAAAAVLRDFARAGQQLFVFTCHEHIVGLFQGLGVEVAELTHGGRVFRAAAISVEEPAEEPREEKPARKRARRRPEPEPIAEPEPPPRKRVARAPEPPKAVEKPVEPARVIARTSEPIEPVVETPDPWEAASRIAPPPYEPPRVLKEFEPEPPHEDEHEEVDSVREPDREERTWRGGLAPWEEPWGEEPGEERDELYPSGEIVQKEDEDGLSAGTLGDDAEENALFDEASWDDDEQDDDLFAVQEEDPFPDEETSFLDDEMGWHENEADDAFAEEEGDDGFDDAAAA